MTLSELTTLARREQERQAVITYEAARNGGAWDSILGRWVEWGEGEPEEDGQ